MVGGPISLFSTNNEELNQPMNQEPGYEYPVIPTRLKDKGVIEYQLDSKDKLSALKESLIGGYYDKKQTDEKGRPKFIKTGHRLCNERFAQMLIDSLIQSVSGKEIYQSIQSENDLKDIKYDFSSEIIRTLWSRHLREWGEVDRRFCGTILTMVREVANFMMMRSLNGETNKQMNANIQVSESSNQYPEVKQTRRGGIGGLFG